MKQYLKTIEETIELFGDKAFYTISFDEWGMSFQGKFQSSIVKKCLEQKYTFEYTTTGYVILTKDQIRIILTD